MNMIRFDFHRKDIYIFHQFWRMSKHFSKRTSKAGNFWPPVGGAINMALVTHCHCFNNNNFKK